MDKALLAAFVGGDASFLLACKGSTMKKMLVFFDFHSLSDKTRLVRPRAYEKITMAGILNRVIYIYDILGTNGEEKFSCRKYLPQTIDLVDLRESYSAG